MARDFEIKLVGSTNGIKNKKDYLKFSQTCARECYSDKEFEELVEEEWNQELINKTLKNGHHSVYEHIHLNFAMRGIPKITAMILNNQKQYVTSEKSARYTKMKEVVPEQKELYDKWMDEFIPLIRNEHPKLAETPDPKDDPGIKLAQENARYMTSVFTPTNMVHTINLRQLNFVVYEFEKYVNSSKNKNPKFKSRLIPGMRDFLRETEKYKVDKLQNQTDRSLCFFRDGNEWDYFGNVYTVKYDNLSFAGLAQAQRHRTIDYQIIENINMGPEFNDFFIPRLLRGNELEKEWIKDLENVSEYDFPQAQQLSIIESGLRSDFRSKLILRLCGHAQNEIMEQTLGIARRYSEEDDKFPKEWLKPKCLQEIGCSGGCIWGGKEGLSRRV